MRYRFRKSCANWALAGLVASAGVVSTGSAFADDPEVTYRVVFAAADDDDDEEVEVTASVEEEEFVEPSLWMGISLKQLEGDLQKHLGADGIFVMDVYPDSPADKAGIKEGDVLMLADDADLAHPSDLLKVISGLEKGDEVSVTLLRKGKKVKLDVKPTDRPSQEDLGIANVEVDVQLDESVEGAKDLLKRLRIDGDAEGVNVFRFGPSYIWKGEKGEGEFNVKIKKSVDGEDMEVTVDREKGAPARVKILGSDSEVMEFEVEDISELPSDLPEEVADIVKGALSKAGGVLKLHMDNGKMPMVIAPGEIDISAVVEGAGDSKEMAEKIRAMITERSGEWSRIAREEAAKAREIAKEARARVNRRVGGQKEIEELRALVEQLRSEISELKEKLDDHE